VANNFRGSGTGTHDDVHGPFTQTFSLIGIADPKLGPLANNGGPTMTHALLSDSPALETGAAATAGSGGVPLYDQRGSLFSRVVDYDGTGGAKLDIGAVEMPRPTPALPGDYSLNQFVDAADYVIWRKTSGTSVTQPYAGADGDGNQTINASDYVVWREQFGGHLSAAASLQIDATDSDSVDTNQSALGFAMMPPSTVADDSPKESDVKKTSVPALDDAMELLLVAVASGDRRSNVNADVVSGRTDSASEEIRAGDELVWPDLTLAEML
jgi:hypothetical protein